MVRLVSLFCVLLAATPLVGPATIARSADTASSLAEQLDAVLSDARLDGVVVGVTVRSATTGEIVYRRDGDLRMSPGSNQKLMTSAAALAELGPGYRFHTSVLVRDRPHAGIVAGDLYLRGGGDPTIVPDRLDELAAALVAAGVKQVGGGLVADDTFFDDVRLGTDWSWQDETFPYAAPISALSLAPDTDADAGSVEVDILPGTSPGTPAQVALTPPTRTMRVDNQVVTGPPGSARHLTGVREHGSNRILVNGTIPLGGRPAQPLLSVDDPTGYTADVFASALARHGVRLATDVPRHGSTPSSAVELADLDSRPLGEVLVPLLKRSSNPMAEMLVKTMGARDAGTGSWDAGLAVVRRFVATHDLDPARLQLVDGSGLSTSDLVAPDDLTALLVAVQREPWFATWYAALPIAGQPEPLVGGTLADRMRDTPAAGNVHAKTGTLATASALSGYVATAAGEAFVFSIIESGFVGAPLTDVEDRVAVTLASLPDCVVICGSARAGDGR
jgi:D-alanyl-D-alanine carboxypeptidase/D-alanyl-D-alanine-endopeptidase (penicillin-binding protein 4)